MTVLRAVWWHVPFFPTSAYPDPDPRRKSRRNEVFGSGITFVQCSFGVCIAMMKGYATTVLQGLLRTDDRPARCLVPCSILSNFRISGSADPRRKSRLNEIFGSGITFVQSSFGVCIAMMKGHIKNRVARIDEDYIWSRTVHKRYDRFRTVTCLHSLSEPVRFSVISWTQLL
jgi:hypothetical protein